MVNYSVMCLIIHSYNGWGSLQNTRPNAATETAMNVRRWSEGVVLPYNPKQGKSLVRLQDEKKVSQYKCISVRSPTFFPPLKYFPQHPHTNEKMDYCNYMFISSQYIHVL